MKNQPKKKKKLVKHRLDVLEKKIKTLGLTEEKIVIILPDWVQ